MKKTRTAVLISGRGSNMMALVKAAKAPDYPADISLVISNRPEAPGLDSAAGCGIETLAIDHTAFDNRRAFEHALHRALVKHRIDFVCCAGFMRILSPWFTEQWAGRIINIHPSLLPKYKGLHTHHRAIDAGDTQHGCTVHWVTSELDGGDIIRQSRISIEPSDTPDTLAEKLIPIEHETYVQALQDVLQ